MGQLNRTFPGGYIRQVTYDTRDRVLELSFETGRVMTYVEVPEWVYQKLVSSPSPRSFWEDSIREEYSGKQGKKAGKSDAAREALNKLFGP